MASERGIARLAVNDRGAPPSRSSGGLALPRLLLSLTLVGALVGAFCWPLTLVDRLQDQLVGRLPAFSATPWSLPTLLLALTPLVAMPLILGLQAGIWPEGASSGIPQTLVSLKDPEEARLLLAPAATRQRLVLWSLASLALLPLGREGPVVHLSAALAQGLRRRWPGLLHPLDRRAFIALCGGAGMASAFDTPLVGVVFMLEELSRRIDGVVIPAAMVVCAVAGEMNHWGGQPEFALAVLRESAGELDQLVLALPIGLAGGLVGVGFSTLILRLSALLGPLAKRRPLLLGLALGGLLSGLCLLTGGVSGGDGEVVMTRLVGQPQLGAGGWPGFAARVVGPSLCLGAGVPGGLIDPALALGALVGRAIGQPFHSPLLGIALGLAAALAGATQLPLVSVMFSLRLLGDQQWLPGVVLAGALGAGLSRLLGGRAIYHVLAERLMEQRAVDRAAAAGGEPGR
ncbi:MAG: chloride channel protein [Cyanobacteria bacterium K_Offshore_surface_m2_239]|nr:chloride channel protein [Cyanobacteria bacterium K_Offshore_surface_m2_239]